MNAIVQPTARRTAKASKARLRQIATDKALRRARVLRALRSGELACISLGIVGELLRVKSATARKVIRGLAAEGAVVLEPYHGVKAGHPRMTWILKEHAPAVWPPRVKKRVRRPMGPCSLRRQAILAVFEDRKQHSAGDFAHLFGEGRPAKVHAGEALRTLYKRGILTREYEPPQDHRRGAPRMLYRLKEGKAAS